MSTRLSIDAVRPGSPQHGAGRAAESRSAPEIFTKFTGERHRIGAAEVDLELGVVRAPDRRETGLRRQSAEVLRVLAARRGGIVTKSELMNSVWGDIAVTDDSLVKCVGDIRRALGAARDMLRTVARRGYILVRDEAEAATAVSSGFVVAVIGGASAAGDPTAAALAEEFVAHLTHELWRCGDVALVAAGVPVCPGGLPDLREVAAGLGAQYLLICRTSGAPSAATALIQLFEGATAQILWSRALGQSGVTAAELARCAAAELAGYGGQFDRIRRKRSQNRPESGMDARDLYLLAFEGAEGARSLDREESLKALDAAALCTRNFPEFARGWIVTSWLHHNHALQGWGDTRPDWEREEYLLCRRAVDADPNDPIALCFLGLASAKLGATASAIRLFERSAETCERQPDCAMDLSIGFSAVVGDPHRALRLIDRARDLTPDAPAYWGYMECRAAFLAGRFERALTASDIAPDTAQKLVFRALAAAELGDDREAVACWSSLKARIPGFDLRSYARMLPITHPAAIARCKAGAAKLRVMVAAADA